MCSFGLEGKKTDCAMCAPGYSSSMIMVTSAEAADLVAT